MVTAMNRLSSVVSSDSQILNGVTVFAGTRVPVRILFEFLSAGDSLDKFLDAYPSVTRAQALKLLELAEDFLEAGARTS